MMINPLPNSEIDADGKTQIAHFALLRTYRGRYTSAKARLNVWGLPQVTTGQSSGVAVYVMNVGDGSPGVANVVQAGWQVNPLLYGDHDTHFYVYWTADDGQKTGCHNLRCKGFVLLNSSTFIPGATKFTVSTYDGIQNFIIIKISKDPKTGDWWLYHGINGDEPIGYWPKSLFTTLADVATNVDFGGVVTYTEDQKGPPMGSGHRPGEGKGKAASLTNVEVNDQPYKGVTDERYVLYTDYEKCYDIYSSGQNVNLLYLGGPGGC